MSVISWDRQDQASIWKGTVAGLVGGLAASWAMNQFQSALAAVGRSGGDQQPAKQEDDATMKAAAAISESLADHHLSRDEKRIAGPIVHYAFGSAMGALYGALGEVAPAATKGWGLPFGAALWAGADEIGVPLAGLSGPPDEVPVSTHASALASHLVYGVTADAIRRLVRAALGRGNEDEIDMVWFVEVSQPDDGWDALDA